MSFGVKVTGSSPGPRTARSWAWSTRTCRNRGAAAGQGGIRQCLTVGDGAGARPCRYRRRWDNNNLPHPVLKALGMRHRRSPRAGIATASASAAIGRATAIMAIPPPPGSRFMLTSIATYTERASSAGIGSTSSGLRTAHSYRSSLLTTALPSLPPINPPPSPGSALVLQLLPPPPPPPGCNYAIR